MAYREEERAAGLEQGGGALHGPEVGVGADGVAVPASRLWRSPELSRTFQNLAEPSRTF